MSGMPGQDHPHRGNQEMNKRVMGDHPLIEIYAGTRASRDCSDLSEVTKVDTTLPGQFACRDDCRPK